jgi:hypothetical protein
MGHALVIGGSVAGLCAARVISDFFEQVTVLERDAYPKDDADQECLTVASSIGF